MALPLAAATHRVPVAVVDDDRVCSGQVDAQAACPRGQQEDGVLLRALVEAVDATLPFSTLQQECRQQVKRCGPKSG